MTDWSPPIEQRRQQYVTSPIGVADLDRDPVAQFWKWFDDADQARAVEPHAMVVSTVDRNGAPDSRIVLARAVTSDGIDFYTNYESTKSRQLDAQPLVATVFSWLAVHRQVRVRGRVHRVAESESDDYFASRPRASQIGAWASSQSRPIADRKVLDDAVAELERRFEGIEVPRPSHWGGWRIEPTEWEFWQGRPDRLHDRFAYRDLGNVSGATITRLSP